MNRQEILKLVREHFKGGGVCDDGSCTEYYGDPDAFVKFAQAIHEDGYNKGYDRGYEDGYESAKVSTEMNTWSSDDD